MSEPTVPTTIADAARAVFDGAVKIYEAPGQRCAIEALLRRCSEREGSAAGLHLLRSFLDSLHEPAKPPGYWSFFVSGKSFKQAIGEVFTLPPGEVETVGPGARKSHNAKDRAFVANGPLVLTAQDPLCACLWEWLARWQNFARLWLEWSRCSDAARAALSTVPPSSGPPTGEHLPARVLTNDQQIACERLLALAQVRSVTSEASLPASVLGRWSVPLLVGPAGSGKTFVCQETARRLNRQPCRRWDIGSWIIVANRSTHTTLEQIQTFVEANPLGCVVYLAGVEALAAEPGRNGSYFQALATEVEQALEMTSNRPVRFVRRDGSTFPAKVLLVVGGQFSGLWGDVAIGRFSGSESWRNADQEPLADARAVAAWLAENSGVPASILRRLAATPLVLHPLNRDEAGEVAARLHENLPRSLDGISVDELAVALHGPLGWRAVNGVIEQAVVAGYESLPTAKEDTNPTPSPSPKPPDKAAEPKRLKPMRLSKMLGLPADRSPLLTKAERLGMGHVRHLENLAIARDFFIPGEDSGWVTPLGQVGTEQFTNAELALALLSPCQDFEVEVILRGTVILAAVLAVYPPSLVLRVARRARAELVLRHIALLAEELHPPQDRWRKLLALLPAVSPEHPALAPGVMPDEPIKSFLASCDS